MKFYRGKYRAMQEGTMVVWGTSKAEVTKRLKHVAYDCGVELDPDNHFIEKMEVDPTLKSFVSFLNIYFTTDNG